MALVLVIIVLGAAHRLWAATARQNQMTWRTQQQRVVAGTIGEVLDRDLSCLHPRWDGQPPLEFQRTGAARGKLELKVTTASGQFSPTKVQRPLVRRVTYTVEPSPERPGMYLLRRSELPYPTDDEDEIGAGFLLTDNVTDVSVEAYDGLNWVEQWPVEEATEPPLALRVELAFGGGDTPGVTILKVFDTALLPRPRIVPRREKEEGGQ